MEPGKPTSPSPRAFAQGAGTVFQAVGVVLFVATMLSCCGSALMPRQWVTDPRWTQSGWSLGAEEAAPPRYSIQRATSVAVAGNLALGLALAGVGLGLQAERRRAAGGALATTMLGAAFWLVHAAIAVQHVPSWPVKVLAVGHAVLFVALAGLAVGAWRTMHRHPPPAGHEVLPADYKVPYSHLHADPPEVRLAQELAQRRQRLAHEQAELQQLEEKLREASRQNPGREP